MNWILKLMFGFKKEDLNDERKIIILNKTIAIAGILYWILSPLVYSSTMNILLTLLVFPILIFVLLLIPKNNLSSYEGKNDFINNKSHILKFLLISSAIFLGLNLIADFYLDFTINKFIGSIVSTIIFFVSAYYFLYYYAKSN